MNKPVITILVFITISVFFSCDYVDNKLTIQNNTKDSIAFIIENVRNNYPTNSTDTLKNIDKLKNVDKIIQLNSQKKSFVYFVGHDEHKSITIFNTKWEYLIEDHPNKRLVVYFYPVSVFTTGKYKWKDILLNSVYIKRVDYTIDELEKNKWIIEYK